jgi:hypothetical protein
MRSENRTRSSIRLLPASALSFSRSLTTGVTAWSSLGLGALGRGRDLLILRHVSPGWSRPCYFQTCLAFLLCLLVSFYHTSYEDDMKKRKMTKNKYWNILLNITKNGLGTTVPYLAHIGPMVSLIIHIPVLRTHYTNLQCTVQCTVYIQRSLHCIVVRTHNSRLGMGWGGPGRGSQLLAPLVKVWTQWTQKSTLTEISTNRRPISQIFGTQPPW